MVIACYMLSMQQNFEDAYLKLTNLLKPTTEIILRCIDHFEKEQVLHNIGMLLCATCINWFGKSLRGKALTVYKSPPMILELASEFLNRLDENDEYTKKPPMYALVVFQSLLYWDSVGQLNIDSSKRQLVKCLIEKITTYPAKRNEKRLALLERFFSEHDIELKRNILHDNGYFSAMLVHFQGRWYDVDYPQYLYLLRKWNHSTHLVPNGELSWRIGFARSLHVPVVMLVNQKVTDTTLPLGDFIQRKINWHKF